MDRTPPREAVFEALVRTLPELALVVTGDGEFVEVIANDRTRELLYEESGDLQGERLRDVFPADRAAEFEAVVQRALATGDVQRHEYELPAGGERRHFRAHVAPLPSTDDLVIWTAEDVTERRERTRELERHEAFLENIRDLVTVVDEEGTIRYESSAVADLYGFEPGERVGDSAFEYVHPEDRERVERRFAKRLAGDGRPETLEYRVRNADGTWTWVESWARFDVADLSADAILITTRDVSEREAQRQALQRSHDLLATTEQLADVGGWEVDLEAETVTWTDGTRRIHETPPGYDPTLEEAIEFFHPDDREQVRRAVRTCSEDGTPYDIEVRLVTYGDRTRWVRISGDRVDREGRHLLRGAIADVTAQKQREQHLMVLNRVLRHNLRNDVNVVRGYAESVRQSVERLEAADAVENDPIVRDALDVARTAAGHVAETAEGLESLVAKTRRFERAYGTDRISEEVDVRGLAESVRSEYEEQYPDATIVVEGDDATIVGDRTALRQVVSELLENALEHTDDEQPTVTVTVRTAATERVIVSVADAGPGIPESERQVFEQGEETALVHGSGIGLWLVNWLVTHLGGTVDLTDGDPEGTVATVELPVRGTAGPGPGD